tara:strand:- start:2526 stop:3704 length:1179 start_codon:yes stop_codon:yes gene_type:complete
MRFKKNKILFLAILLFSFGEVIQYFPNIIFRQLLLFICSLLFAFFILLSLRELNKITLSFILIFLFSLISGLLHGPERGAYLLDIVVAISIIPAFFIDTKKYESGILSYIYYITAIYLIIILLFFSGIFQYTIDELSRRILISDDLFLVSSAWWIYTFFLGTFFYSNSQRKKIVFALMTFLYFTSSVLFLKRGFVVDILLSVSTYFWIQSKFKMFYPLTLLLFVSGLIIIIFITNPVLIPLYDIWTLRVVQIEETGGNYRVTETLNYLKKLSFHDFFYGSGLGVSHFGIEGKINTSLHIGISNIFHKFGFFGLALFLFIFFRCIMNIINIIYNVRIKNRLLTSFTSFSICIFVSSIPQFLLAANLWYAVPNLMLFLLTARYLAFNSNDFYRL